MSAALPEAADVARHGRLRRLATLLDPRAGPARWPILIALVTIFGWVVVGATIDLWTPYDPVALAGRRLQPPSAAHWLGTDALGRDVLVRTLYGVRFSLPVAVGVLVTAVSIGCLLGALAGYFGGFLDGALMRLADVTLSFPPCC